MLERRTGIFVAISIALPAILLALTHGLGHAGDMEFFHRWYLAFGEAFREPAFGGLATFYRDGPGVNYPIVGALVVCLPARIVEAFAGAPLDLATYRLVLKLTLAIGDVAFILALSRLARLLGAPQPRLLALAIYLVPASWAAGTFFGQIDSVGSVLLVVATSELLAYRRQGSTLTLSLALLATASALLCKQLAWFSLPALLALLGLGLFTHRRRAHLALALASPLVLFAADPFLALPEGFHSHLCFVISAASHHGDLVVATGASLWSLVARPGQDAHDARWLGLSAFAIGWLLFALIQAVALLRARAARFSDQALVEWQSTLHLAMGVVLTGVHERYLAHAWPFALVLLFARREPSWARATLVLGATWWGLFVVASVAWDAFEGSLSFLRMNTPLAALLLICLLAWLARPIAPLPAPDRTVDRRP
ncbi:MAG: hypothetical protein K8H88_00950 [Sandaracinaceae bacterium]|nr:hypothetical protein [Sandaracinaceae bacterium]